MAKPNKPSVAEIRTTWEIFETDEISTGRLTQIVADTLGCKYMDVVDAMFAAPALPVEGE